MNTFSKFKRLLLGLPLLTLALSAHSSVIISSPALTRGFPDVSGVAQNGDISVDLLNCCAPDFKSRTLRIADRNSAMPVAQKNPVSTGQETDQWIMLVAGMGMMVFIVRRRAGRS